MTDHPYFPALPKPLFWQIYLLVWICGSFSAFWPWAGSLALLLLLYACDGLHRPARLVLSLLIFITALALVRCLYATSLAQNQRLPGWAGNSAIMKGRFCGIVREFQGLTGRRTRIVLEKVHPENDPAGEFLPGLCALVRDTPDPFFSVSPGTSLCFTGTIRGAHASLNSKGDLEQPPRFTMYPWLAYYAAHSETSISGEPSSLHAWREKLRQNFLKALGLKAGTPLEDKEWQSPPEQAKALLLALCFGDKRLVSRQTYDNFASATLAHSLALSGQHLGIAGLLSIICVFFITRFHPGLFLHCPRASLILILALPLALLYLWIGNAPPSLLRAACMLFLAALFIWKRSAFGGLDLLAATLPIFILMDPMAIFQTGLQLSLLCVLLIILFAPIVAKAGNLLPNTGYHNKLAKWAFQILLISMIIQLFLLPLNLLNFSIAGLYFPLNLLWLPVLGFLVLPLAFVGLFLASLPGDFFSYMASWLLEMATYPCEWLLLLLEKTRHMDLLAEPAFIRPHWLNLLAFAILAPALAWLFAKGGKETARKKFARFLIIALILLVIPPVIRLYGHLHPVQARLEVLDVGQGLSILLKFPSGQKILYDGGGSAKGTFDPGKAIIAPLISSNYTPKLSAVINSHPDMDHLGGLFYILEHFQVGSLFHNGHEAHEAKQRQWENFQNAPNSRTLFAGDQILLDRDPDGLRLEVLYPPASAIPVNDGTRMPEYGISGNHASLVLRLCKGDEGLALMTGDAEKDTLERILESGRDIRSRVLIAPHHGSDRSLLKAFYEKVDPDLVLVGCGYQNRWNYPGKKLRKLLRDMRIDLLDTASHGKIDVIFAEDGHMAVKTIKGDRTDFP